MKRTGLFLLGIVCAAVASAYEVRPLDWSKLEGGAGNDGLAAMCATVMEHTQDGIGRDWLEKIGKTKRVDGLLDFGYIEEEDRRKIKIKSNGKKVGLGYKRRTMEDCIRPMTTTARTLALAIRAGQYRADKAGAEIAEIEKLFPLVIRSLAMDHNVNGGIGEHSWGDSWQSAMWAGQLAQAAWIVWDQLEPADREPVIKVLVHEADRYLDVAPPVSNKKSVEDTKGEENKWNSGCLLAAATMLRNHPHEAAWREQAIVYFLNAVATPHDVGSSTVVDGKPLSARLRGYCITKDYAVGNHGAYPHPGYTSASYLDTQGLLFCALAGVQPPEAALYNAAPIYRMYVDHEWKAPPCVAPGGTIYKANGGIYWPVEKEAERAGRYYLWFKQDVMAATFGFDRACSTPAATWANQHGQLMVDALTGKPTPVPLESYHKGAFFKTALSCYIIRVLHVNNQLAPIRALSAHVLESGSVSLSVDTAGVRLLPAKDGNNAYRNPAPLELQILNEDGKTRWLRSGYESVQRDGNAMVCRGKIETPGGSLFSFRDVYESDAAGGAIRLSREVDVVKTGTEQGFLSRFALRSSSDFGDHEYFVPAIWYGDNSKARPGALGTQHSDDFFIFREDRMPLPVVMMRNRATGTAITLIHIEPDGSTCREDFAAARVVDARIQVASLGIFGQQKTGVAMYYPAAEGERSYARTPKLRGNPRNAKRWVDRFHPVRRGVSHRYSVLIGVGESDGFSQAMKNAWRMAYDRIHPPLADTDIEASYEASIQLVANRFKTVNGAPGLPFKLSLPDGVLPRPSDYNYQMGFVGQQIPLAYHMLYYGLTKNNSEIAAKGEAMMDFWSANSLTDDGLPRTWYNTMPQPRWRKVPVFLRVVSDGMGGALKAWDVMKQHGKNRPDWLRFCTAFGDWLVKNQNEDGSWYRAYAWDGSVAESGKSNTSNPIRFLVDLHAATGHERYLNAALKAGEYCWDTTHKEFDYVGGTADNPNVLDKEAGFMAMDAFLALWDATGHVKYLEAAAQAADFTETWAYSWKVPLMEDAERIFPSWVPTTGFSIIATGHSGADLFLAGAPYLYYRIYLLTGDEHYADMARQLLYDPRIHVDVNGSLGYAEPGLCTEALSLTVDGKRGRGNGVDVWLPWLTYSMVEPVVRLQEAYGMMDAPNNQSAEQLQRARKIDTANKK